VISLKTSPTGLIGENLETNFSLNRSNCNLLDKNSVVEVLDEIKPDLVFQNAGYIATSYDETRNDIFYLTNNTFVDINVLNSCIKNSVPNLIFFSSTIAVENPIFGANKLSEGKLGYLYSKHEAIKLIDLANLLIPSNFQYKVVILGNLYGPHSKMHTSNSAIDFIIRKLLESIRFNNKEIVFNVQRNVEKSYTFAQDLNKIFFSKNFLDLPAKKILIECPEKISFENLVLLVADQMRYLGKIKFNYEVRSSESSNKFEIDADIFRLKYDFSSLREGIGSTLEVVLASGTD
jgi:nucleoside-diphosphate-sugar epimerase